MGAQWESNGNAMERLMGTQWELNGNPMGRLKGRLKGTQWEPNGNAMGIQWLHLPPLPFLVVLSGGQFVLETKENIKDLARF